MRTLSPAVVNNETRTHLKAILSHGHAYTDAALWTEAIHARS